MNPKILSILMACVLFMLVPSSDAADRGREGSGDPLFHAEASASANCWIHENPERHLVVSVSASARAGGQSGGFYSAAVWGDFISDSDYATDRDAVAWDSGGGLGQGFRTYYAEAEAEAQYLGQLMAYDYAISFSTCPPDPSL